MFDFEEMVKGAKPPQRETNRPLVLGAADRFRIVNHLGGRYFAMRLARRDIRRALASLDAALERGEAVPPALPDALYRYELARATWQSGYRTLMTTFGVDTAKRVWEEIRDRVGGADSETDVVSGEGSADGPT